MFSYKQHQPKKAKRCYRVDNLNPEKGIFSSMKETQDNKYVVCLCLAQKSKTTIFLDESSALREMKRYRQLYK